MSPRTSFEGLDQLVAEHGRALLATATLLAGTRHGGEDLLQAALERVLRNWRGITDSPLIYLRRTLYHLAVDSWRIRRRRPVAALESWPADGPVPEALVEVDPAEALQLRHALMHALSQLPPRQRAVLVLRYWEQLTEAEAAEVLGCSVGTVKSTTSRGLARLRDVVRPWAGAAVVIAAQDLAAEDLAAEDLAAQDLAAQDLAAQDLAAQDLAAEDLAAVPHLTAEGTLA